MKLPLSVQLVALSVFPFAVFSCAFADVDGAPDGEPRATDRAAVSKPGWRPDHVRGSGGGCRFQDDATGPADAFALANGGDMALVFTRLGEATRHGRRRSVTESRCNFAVPLTVPEGQFLSGWAQSVQFGVVKPAGIAAGLSVRSSLDPSRGPAQGLPTLERLFEKESALDVSLDTMASEGTTFREGPDRGNGHRQKWCKRGRVIDHELRGAARTWVERSQNDQDEAVIIAIDGLDMRVDFAATLEACPAR